MQKIFPLFLMTTIMFGSNANLHAYEVSLQSVRAEVSAKQIKVNKLRGMGKDILPLMAQIYEQSNDTLLKAKIAWTWYKLGWKSERAREVMMPDIHTQNTELRLQVQWALGRVSSNPGVVIALLDSMRNDSSVLFRDKAACALASDQIHLTPVEKLPLLEGLVNGLGDSKLQVREISIKALEIQTGQTKGYHPRAQEGERNEKIQVWKEWLQDYRKNL